MSEKYQNLIKKIVERGNMDIPDTHTLSAHYPILVQALYRSKSLLLVKCCDHASVVGSVWYTHIPYLLSKI
jgi:hypothetical protein